MLSTPDHVILIYGQGGLGKSTLLAQTIAHVWKTTGKKGRVVNADGGGTSAALSLLKEKGLVDIWHIDQWNEKSIFGLLELATKGWWPGDLSVPNSPLLPPFKEEKICPYCSKPSGAVGLTMVPKCGACAAAFPPGTLLTPVRTPLNGLESVGVLGFEGMTSFGNLLLNRFRQVDPSGGSVIKDGDFNIAQAGQSHYGLAQNYLMSYFQNVRQIPVEVVLWTALELRADDDGKPLYGPAGPGKALTTRCIPAFTSVLHLDAFPKKAPGGGYVKDSNGMEILERRLFLNSHFPPDNPTQKFAAKTSVPYGGDMPLVVEPDMSKFFAEMDAAKARAMAKLFGK